MACMSAVQLLADPVEFRAKYQAKAYGLSAKAERYLIKISETQYEIRNKIEATAFGTTLAELDERSIFRWQDGNVIVDSYSYEQSGVSSAEESISFNWDTQTATSVEDDESWELSIDFGAMDKLAYQVQLRHLLQTTDQTEFSFLVLDTDELETHNYRVLGEELLATELGTFNTINIERVRREGSSRSTNIWIAPELNYLLVKLEQVNGSGRKVELLVERATIAGEPIGPQR